MHGALFAIAFLAQAEATAQSSNDYGPAGPPVSKPAGEGATKSAESCAPSAPDPKSGEIIVCALKPQGYRIDSDVLKARRDKRSQMAGRLKPPENYKPNDCANVGPMGCRGGPAFNVMAAAATLEQMGQRLAQGQEVGSLFATEPYESEYQLYLDAKKEREAKEEAAAIKKAAAAAKAAATRPTSAAPR
jgi:hypothetical protein